MVAGLENGQFGTEDNTYRFYGNVLRDIDINHSISFPNSPTDILLDNISLAVVSVFYKVWVSINIQASSYGPQAYC